MSEENKPSNSQKKKVLWGVITPATPTVLVLNNPLASSSSSRNDENVKKRKVVLIDNPPTQEIEENVKKVKLASVLNETPSPENNKTKQNSQQKLVINNIGLGGVVPYLRPFKTTEGNNQQKTSEPEVSNFKKKAKVFGANLKRYLQEYANYSGFHGLKFLAEERSLAEKILWLIFILISVVCCVYFIYYDQKKIFKTPIIVSFSTKETPLHTIPFPAVTICTENKANVDKFSYTKVNHKFHKKEKLTEDEFTTYQYLTYICNRQFKDEDLTNFSATFTDHFFKTLDEIKPDFDNLMLRCMYFQTQRPCGQLFKPIYTDIGICYSFNLMHWDQIFTKEAIHYGKFFEHDRNTFDWSVETGYISSHPKTYPRRGMVAGAQGALKLQILRDKTHADPVCTSGMQGLRGTLHKPNELPDFSKSFFRVPYNVSTMIAVEPRIVISSDEIRNLPLSDRKCYLSSERNLKFFKHYSKSHCLMECLANFTLASCGCVAFYMPREKHTKICGLSKLPCIDKQKDELNLILQKKNVFNGTKNTQIKVEESREDLCDCKPLCTTLDYDVVTTTSDWDWRGELRNDSQISVVEMGMCTIFFKSSTYLNLQRTQFYGKVDLWGNIGGVINLFLGFSLITIAELAYFCTLRIIINKIIYGMWAGPYT